MVKPFSLDDELSKACKNGNLAMAQELVRQGADISSSHSGSPPLFRAAHSGHAEVVRWLLKKGADVNGRNSVGSTALMGAEQGKLDCVEALLEAGADKTPKNEHGLTARDYAVRNNRGSILATLDRNPDEVVFSWRVNDRTLQEVFNFAHKERVTLIRKSADGPVEAVTRESFSEITDRAKLREAFEKYRSKGGTRTEEEVFSSGDILRKPRLGR